MEAAASCPEPRTTAEEYHLHDALSTRGCITVHQKEHSEWGKTMSRAPQVKNRAPAPIQITAEQLLREAKERDLETVSRAPKQYIADNEELQLYRQGKRKDYENQIRRQRHLIGVWCKYALWEASQKEFVRARSVFERALDVDYRSQTIWFKYAEMEMKNKFINHARNIWDRAVSLLPRVDTFWYKYSYMEEMVGAIDEARQVFERWMKWMPDDMGWAAYIKFEMRQGSVKRARAIYERYMEALPTCRAYLKYARWEEHNKERGRARTVYERALGGELPPSEQKKQLLVSFARFEERSKEYDRARVIFQYAIDQASAQVQASESEADEAELREIKTEFTAFEKRHGDKAGIEDVILNNRREHYNELLKADPFHYDTWFDLCRLEEAELEGTAEGSPEHSQALERCRDTYERAIANVPPLAEKRYWRRYIYLWIGYALLEELHGPPSLSDPLKDDSSDSGLAAGGLPSGIDRARDVYRACLQLIPHKKFTFGKLWLFAAQLEVRARDLGAARKLLGRAIGMCGKENIFKGYIELELQLGEVERCRAIYGKYLEFMPHNCSAWQAFAQLEINVGEIARARAIYELAISQPELDMPEILWKAFIDFEVSEGEADNARALFGRLLDRTNHVKVWISYGQFESSDAGGGLEAARKVFSDGYASLKVEGLKEERVLLLEAWKDVETAQSTAGGDPQSIAARMPRKIKMRRMAAGAEPSAGKDAVWEEYFDYHFPDDEKNIAGIKILENAMKWKQMMAATGSGVGSGGGSASAAVVASEGGEGTGPAGVKRGIEALSDDS